MNFEADDLDWALGELLHLTWEAKCASVLPPLQAAVVPRLLAPDQLVPVRSAQSGLGYLAGHETDRSL